MPSSDNPYKHLPSRNFWRSAVADPGPFEIADLHRTDLRITPETRIVTFGSCFAQTLSKALLERGYRWHDAEPPPPMMSETTARQFNYGVFSARTGNIYTAALLRQWFSWAITPDSQDTQIWATDNNRCVDPLRPAIEPDGFRDPEELFAARNRTLAALCRILQTADIMIFTLGLTEFWRDGASGMVFQMCPGTQGGHFDPSAHEFCNATCSEVAADLEATAALISRVNPDLKMILTVSPVALTATAEPDCHALVANTYTKSTLRSAAGEVARNVDGVEYFPSYELVATPPMRGMFYSPNQRTIAQAGVDLVMDAFFDSYAPSKNLAGRNPSFPGKMAAVDANKSPDTRELICDDMILEFYNQERKRVHEA